MYFSKVAASVNGFAYTSVVLAEVEQGSPSKSGMSNLENDTVHQRPSQDQGDIRGPPDKFTSRGGPGCNLGNVGPRPV